MTLTGVPAVLAGQYPIYGLHGEEYKEAVRQIMDKLLQQLQKQGPLPLDGLRYHVNLANKWDLQNEDIQIVIRRKPRVFTIHAYGEDNADLCMTKVQYREQMQPMLPAPRDFAVAYYELAAYLRLVRENPEHLNVPMEPLRQLGLL